MGSCVHRVIALAMLLALLAGAWLYRDHLARLWREARGIEESAVVPTPELAAIAENKIEELRNGTRTSVALSQVELQSLIDYRFQGALPAFLAHPTVELEGDIVRLRARVPIDKLPRVEGLSEITDFLPDTTDFAIAAKLLPLDSGRVAFGIDQVSAARVPLPRRIVPGALDRIGRKDEPGLPRDAIAVTLPPGVAAAYVRRDSLFLLRRGGTSN